MGKISFTSFINSYLSSKFEKVLFQLKTKGYEKSLPLVRNKKKKKN